MQQHSACMNQLTYCCCLSPAALLYMVGHWVGESVGRVLYVLLLLSYCCCSTTAVHPKPNSTCGERRKGPSPRGVVKT